MLIDNIDRIEIDGKEVEAIYIGDALYFPATIEKYSLYGDLVDYAESDGTQIMNIGTISAEQSKQVTVLMDFQFIDSSATDIKQGIVSDGNNNMYIGKNSSDILTYGNFDLQATAYELFPSNERKTVVVDYANSMYIIDSTQVSFADRGVEFDSAMNFTIFGYNTGNNADYVGEKIRNYHISISVDGATIINIKPIKLTKRAYGDYPLDSIVMWDFVKDEPVEYTGNPLSGGSLPVKANIKMEQRNDDLYVVYNDPSDKYPTFNIKEDGNLYVTYDEGRVLDLRIDQNGDLIQTI